MRILASQGSAESYQKSVRLDCVCVIVAQNHELCRAAGLKIVGHKGKTAPSGPSSCVDPSPATRTCISCKDSGYSRREKFAMSSSKPSSPRLPLLDPVCHFGPREAYFPQRKFLKHARFSSKLSESLETGKQAYERAKEVVKASGR